MIEILKVLLKWKKQVFGFCFLAVLMSIIITMPFIMPPYFQSKTIFYLSNPSSTDRATLFNEKDAGNISIFGGKEDVNRFLSILNAGPTAYFTTEKFNLGKHYKIKAKNAELINYYTQKEFKSNFEAIKNDLGAIEVSIIDTDSKLAAEILKFIIQYSDSIYRTMLVENKHTTLQLLEKQIEEKKSNTTLTNSDELKKLISIRDQYAVSSSTNFKSLYMVEEPSQAVKKSKPIRWLIVLATAFASFLLATFIALLIELSKNVSTKQSIHS